MVAGNPVSAPEVVVSSHPWLVEVLALYMPELSMEAAVYSTMGDTPSELILANEYMVSLDKWISAFEYHYTTHKRMNTATIQAELYHYRCLKTIGFLKIICQDYNSNFNLIPLLSAYRNQLSL